MDIDLKWPVVECETCGFNLREKTPKAREKANDPRNGKPIWTDFCPGCGHGLIVGDRVLPAPTAEVLAERDVAPVLAYAEAKDLAKEVSKASGVPPDVRGAALAKTEEANPDPEGLINKQTETTAVGEKPEPGAIKPPGKGEYFCTKCASNHKDTDKPKSIGLRHKKYREA